MNVAAEIISPNLFSPSELFVTIPTLLCIFFRKIGIRISEKITPIVITHDTAANIFGSVIS